MDKEKEILKSELCIEKDREENALTKKEDVPTPLQFHKSTARLFEIVAIIYKNHYRENEREEYSIKGFKSALSLYVGFHERNIGPRFNLLASLGIIRVKEPNKMNRKGIVFLDLEKLLEYCDDAELWSIWLKKQKEESK